MKPGIQSLAALGWFTAFTPGHLATLNDLADLARVGPDEVLVRADAPCEELMLLLAGFVAEMQMHKGADIITNVVAPVTPICLASALLGLASPTSARTITAARLLVFPAQALRDLIRADPALGLPFLDHALAGMQEASDEARRLKLLSATQRLAVFLITLVTEPEMAPARFVLPYEKRYLAARIGCSQENLSRAFATLRGLGVQTQRGIVVVRDIAALRAFAAL